MTTLAPPDPATRQAEPRYVPYRTFVEEAFQRDGSRSAAERNLYRFLYKAFRRQEHSSPFSARAQVANSIMRVEKIRRLERSRS